jgi:FtsP/CotA-like multicopper oxidase with cupredoxin domain
MAFSGDKNRREANRVSIKDVAMLGGYQEMQMDFTADQPGLSLFHCYMQLHMDYGFMNLFNAV